jgi:hypothetical protein
MWTCHLSWDGRADFVRVKWGGPRSGTAETRLPLWRIDSTLVSLGVFFSCGEIRLVFADAHRRPPSRAQTAVLLVIERIQLQDSLIVCGCPVD